MFLKKIKLQLHKVLFPLHEKEIKYLRKTLEDRDDDLQAIQREIYLLRSKAKQAIEAKPTMADLMRESLGVERLDFYNVDTEGVPTHFLNTENKELRNTYLAQLAQIWQLDVFEVMCKNHIDIQGNFSFRAADGELQILAGRMSVNGISLIRNEVKKGYDEFMERSKPPEEFDEFETTEGISIKKE